MSNASLDKSRTLDLRFVLGSFATSDGYYGTGLYGGEDQTYGQIRGESALPGVNYVILPGSSSRPHAVSWHYRAHDTARRFEASIIPLDKPNFELDLTSVVRATLILSGMSAFGGVQDRRIFDLDVDYSSNQVWRNWEQDDLDRIGRYLVNIRLVFGTGRVMTVGTDDDQALQVSSATVGAR